MFLLVGLIVQKPMTDASIQYLSEPSYHTVNDLTGADLVIKDGSVTHKGMTVELSNQTNDILTYGSFYAIEKYTSGKWYKVPYTSENISWTLEGRWLEPNNTIEIKTEWK